MAFSLPSPLFGEHYLLYERAVQRANKLGAMSVAARRWIAAWELIRDWECEDFENPNDDAAWDDVPLNIIGWTGTAVLRHVMDALTQDPNDVTYTIPDPFLGRHDRAYQQAVDGLSKQAKRERAPAPLDHELQWAGALAVVEDWECERLEKPGEVPFAEIPLDITGAVGGDVWHLVRQLRAGADDPN